MVNVNIVLMKTHDLRCNSFLEIPSSHFTTLFFLIIYLYYIFNCLVNMFIILFTIIHWNLLPVGEMLSLSLKGVYMQSSYQLIKFLFSSRPQSVKYMRYDCMHVPVYLYRFLLVIPVFFFCFFSFHLIFFLHISLLTSRVYLNYI